MIKRKYLFLIMLFFLVFISFFIINKSILAEVESDYYEIVNREVYFDDKLIINADAETFKPLADFYAKDINNVYYMDQIIEGADSNSFVILSRKFGKDNIFVYEYLLKKENYDAESFEVLSVDRNNTAQYWKDKNGVYFKYLIEGADSNSFILLSNLYSKDNNNVYYCFYSKCEIIKEADAATFLYLNDGYAEDKNNKYYADPTGYKIVESNENNNKDNEDKEVLFEISNMGSRLAGKLLLQVEDRGRIWYVFPENNKRYEVTFGNALNLFQKLSLGVSNNDLNKIGIHSDSVNENIDSDNDGFSDKSEVVAGYNPFLSSDVNNRGNDKIVIDKNLSNRLKGRLLLQVEDKGRIWYVDFEGKRWEATWINLMDLFKKLSLGITDNDLNEIVNEDIDI